MTTGLALADRVAGPVLTPADAGYAEEVATLDLNLHHSPDIVVGATGVDDVVAAVGFAREHGMQVGVLGAGHGGPETVEGGLLITTRRLDGLTIDRDARTASVGAGVQWGRLVEETGAVGLCCVPGASRSVGVVGYLLGGGFGPLARSHGVSADWVQAFTLVTAGGDVVRADADHEPELFWALRGGKGGFGVVTEVTLRLDDRAEVYAGALTFGAESSREVVTGWLAWAVDAPPEDVTSSLAVVHLPDSEDVPPPLRGRTIVQVRFAYPGDAAEGERLAAPLRALAPVMDDRLGVLPTGRLGDIHDDPDGPSPLVIRAVMLDRADQGLADAVLGIVDPGRDSPLVFVELRQLGGRVVSGSASAVGAREAGFTMLAAVPGPAGLAELDRVEAMVRPWSAALMNINWAGVLDAADRFDACWPTAVRQRLARIRRLVDPGGLFRFSRWS